ncbi:MAG: hypothetical protein IT307_16445 [Chloroflexi bacterium]|nr:hypothetical protein [Chloroflexota bacterium]
MSLFDYDYDELARRVQSRLDRLTVDYLKSRGARIKRDVLDFHGDEHIELEVDHGGHRLSVRQLGPATGLDPANAPPLEVFDSTFDSQPAAKTSAAMLARWLAELPVGEAAPERKTSTVDADNPFAGGPVPDAPRDPGFNPFLRPRQEAGGKNPFQSGDAGERKKRALEWLGGDDD